MSDAPSVLASISTVISKLQSNISNVRTENRNGSFVDVVLDVDVRNLNHLDEVIKGLKELSSVLSVRKAD